MEVTKYNQIESINQHYDSAEGGINLADFKDKIIRQIHIVTGVTLTISSLAFFRAINSEPNYQASFEILSEPVTIETKVTSSGSQSRETTEAITAVRLNEVQVKTLKSPQIVLSAIEGLQDQYPGLNYNSVVSTLSLETNQDETVLEVIYRNSDRQQVKDILESLKIAYLQYSLERRQLGVNRGLDFLNQQIPTIQGKVDALNQELQQLRSTYNFIEPKIQGVQISERIDNLLIKQTDKQSQLETTEKQATLAIKELNRESTTSTTAMEIGTNRYNKLLENLRELEREIAQKSAIFHDRSFEIKTLQDQKVALTRLIEQEKSTIQQKIDNQIQLEQEQVQSIEYEINNLQQELQQWSGVTRQYETIERQMKITVEQLNELLIQREALRLEASQNAAPWRLLTPVGEPKTDAAATTNYLILGSLLGLLVGIGIALILDQYQNLVYNSTQVKEITNQPILGIIPFDYSNIDSNQGKLSFHRIIKLIKLSKQKAESLEFQEQSAIQVYGQGSTLTNLSASSREAFRFLGANLSLFEIEIQEKIHSLMITSAISGEGKSTVVFNLAQAKAAMGTRVLIVETDLRNFEKSNQTNNLTDSPQGLSDLLLSDNLSLNDVIQKSDVEDNLFILSPGKASNYLDTSKLLASVKMRDLMEELKETFDLVIYDVASIVARADVSLLASKTDGIILVTGLGILQEFKLKEAMNQLNIGRIPILGIVVNKMTASV